MHFPNRIMIVKRVTPVLLAGYNLCLSRDVCVTRWLFGNTRFLDCIRCKPQIPKTPFGVRERLPVALQPHLILYVKLTINQSPLRIQAFINELYTFQRDHG